jgi:hypothetical protein
MSFDDYSQYLIDEIEALRDATDAGLLHMRDTFWNELWSRYGYRYPIN